LEKKELRPSWLSQRTKNWEGNKFKAQGINLPKVFPKKESCWELNQTFQKPFKNKGIKAFLPSLKIKEGL